MSNILYGCDLNKKITPIKARDAVVECFRLAHADILKDMDNYADKEQGNESLENLKKLNVELLIKKIFGEIGADYHNPKKEDIMKVCDELMKYASNFRKQDEIKKHYNQIQSLVDKIEDN